MSEEGLGSGILEYENNFSECPTAQVMMEIQSETAELTEEPPTKYPTNEISQERTSGKTTNQSADPVNAELTEEPSTEYPTIEISQERTPGAKTNPDADPGNDCQSESSQNAPVFISVATSNNVFINDSLKENQSSILSAEKGQVCEEGISAYETIDTGNEISERISMKENGIIHIDAPPPDTPPVTVLTPPCSSSHNTILGRDNANHEALNPSGINISKTRKPCPLLPSATPQVHVETEKALNATPYKTSIIHVDGSSQSSTGSSSIPTVFPGSISVLDSSKNVPAAKQVIIVNSGQTNNVPVRSSTQVSPPAPKNVILANSISIQMAPNSTCPPTVGKGPCPLLPRTMPQIQAKIPLSTYSNIIKSLPPGTVPVFRFSNPSQLSALRGKMQINSSPVVNTVKTTPSTESQILVLQTLPSSSTNQAPVSECRVGNPVNVTQVVPSKVTSVKSSQVPASSVQVISQKPVITVQMSSSHTPGTSYVCKPKFFDGSKQRQVGNATGDSERNRHGQIKRPMNAFMIWSRGYRAKLAKSMPRASNADVSIKLGEIWQLMSEERKKPYYDEACRLKQIHKEKHPDWIYRPQPRGGKRRDSFPWRKPIEDHSQDSPPFGCPSLTLNSSDAYMHRQLENMPLSTATVPTSKHEVTVVTSEPKENSLDFSQNQGTFMSEEKGGPSQLMGPAIKEELHGVTAPSISSQYMVKGTTSIPNISTIPVSHNFVSTIGSTIADKGVVRKQPSLLVPLSPAFNGSQTCVDNETQSGVGSAELPIDAMLTQQSEETNAALILQSLHAQDTVVMAIKNQANGPGVGNSTTPKSVNPVQYTYVKETKTDDQVTTQLGRPPTNSLRKFISMPSPLQPASPGPEPQTETTAESLVEIKKVNPPRKRVPDKTFAPFHAPLRPAIPGPGINQIHFKIPVGQPRIVGPGAHLGLLPRYPARFPMYQTPVMVNSGQIIKGVNIEHLNPQVGPGQVIVHGSPMIISNPSSLAQVPGQTGHQGVTPSPPVEVEEHPSTITERSEAIPHSESASVEEEITNYEGINISSSCALSSSVSTNPPTQQNTALQTSCDTLDRTVENQTSAQPVAGPSTTTITDQASGNPPPLSGSFTEWWRLPFSPYPLDDYYRQTAETANRSGQPFVVPRTVAIGDIEEGGPQDDVLFYGDSTQWENYVDPYNPYYFSNYRRWNGPQYNVPTVDMQRWGHYLNTGVTQEVHAHTKNPTLVNQPATNTFKPFYIQSPAVFTNPDVHPSCFGYAGDQVVQVISSENLCAQQVENSGSTPQQQIMSVPSETGFSYLETQHCMDDLNQRNLPPRKRARNQ